MPSSETLTEVTVSIPAADVHSPSTNSGTKSTSYYVLAAPSKRIKCANCWEPFADNQLLYVNGIPYCKGCIWQRKYEFSDEDYGDGLDFCRGLWNSFPMMVALWIAILALGWEAWKLL